MKYHIMHLFHQGLLCLLRQKQSSEKEIQYLLKIITCDHSIYTMDHPDLSVCSSRFILDIQKENEWLWLISVF